MRWIFAAVAALTILPTRADAAPRAILHDAVALNIGINCQWQSNCMSQQRVAMKRALTYVAKQRPPQWRIHLCNRNASRGGARVDWAGFNHCIRNASLKAQPPRARKRSRR
jgi:hypothetical protein